MQSQNFTIPSIAIHTVKIHVETCFDASTSTFHEICSVSVHLYIVDSSQFIAWCQCCNACWLFSNSSIVIDNRMSVHCKKIETQKSKKKRARRWPIERNRFPNLALLMELKTNEPIDYRNYSRMDHPVPQHLLDKVQPKVRW